MNREVIKKYKEAFDWWLEGGKVWTKKGYDIWHINKLPHWGCEDCIYIPDDEYAELRKAFWDGKKLQFIPKNMKNEKWQDWNLDDCPSKISFQTNKWRIKPKEWYENLDGTRENGVICWVWDEEKEEDKVISLVIDYKRTDSYPFKTYLYQSWECAEPIKCSDLKDFQKEEK